MRDVQQPQEGLTNGEKQNVTSRTVFFTAFTEQPWLPSAADRNTRNLKRIDIHRLKFSSWCF